MSRIATCDSHILIAMDGATTAMRVKLPIHHKAKADSEAVPLGGHRAGGSRSRRSRLWPTSHPGKLQLRQAHGRSVGIFAERANDTRTSARRSDECRTRPNHLLFLMSQSGTTGRPKGCIHSTGGYLSYVAGTSKYYQDIHPEDTYWCFADIGWIT